MTAPLPKSKAELERMVRAELDDYIAMVERDAAAKGRQIDSWTMWMGPSSNASQQNAPLAAPSPSVQGIGNQPNFVGQIQRITQYLIDGEEIGNWRNWRESMMLAVVVGRHVFDLPEDEERAEMTRKARRQRMKKTGVKYA